MPLPVVSLVPPVLPLAHVAVIDYPVAQVLRRSN